MKPSDEVVQRVGVRGVRYPLAVLLTIALLAKLAGYSKARAIADWAKLRAAELAELLAGPPVVITSSFATCPMTATGPGPPLT